MQPWVGLLNNLCGLSAATSVALDGTWESFFLSFAMCQGTGSSVGHQGPADPDSVYRCSLWGLGLGTDIRARKFWILQATFRLYSFPGTPLQLASHPSLSVLLLFPGKPVTFI